MKTYLVGGAVRDILLHRPVRERDWVVVGATPEQMLELGFRPVGKDFPVFLHPESKEEYALARTERKTGPGYTGFDCDAGPAVTLEQDLLRRDLTINAMAQDDAGVLIDPYGGQSDLEARVLRHVSPAFEEDPLRVLRVARFAARYHDLGFTIAPETAQLLARMAQRGDLSELVPERVWQELHHALDGPHPDVFFEVLEDVGALPRLLPALGDLQQRVRCREDLRLAASRSDQAAVRFAAMLHSLDASTIGTIAERLRLPREERELALLACRHALECNQPPTHSADDLMALLEALDAFRKKSRFDSFLTVCAALREEEQSPSIAAQLARCFETALRVGGAEAEGDLSGPALGAAIRRLRIDAIARLLEEGEIR